MCRAPDAALRLTDPLTKPKIKHSGTDVALDGRDNEIPNIVIEVAFHNAQLDWWVAQPVRAFMVSEP